MSSELKTTGKPPVSARVKTFYKNSRRIFKVAHKPSKKEYWMMTKISLVGFAILGVLSFIIHQIVAVVDPLFLQIPG